MSPEPVRVVVLYSHPLMGEGLGRMLAAEPGIVVEAVDVTEQAAVDAALDREPAVIVIEEGGGVDAADVVRRAGSALVLDVDITTTRAWTLKRETLSSRPDDFMAAIRTAVNGPSAGSPGAASVGGPSAGSPGAASVGGPSAGSPGAAPAAPVGSSAAAPKIDPDRPLQPSAIPG